MYDYIGSFGTVTSHVSPLPPFLTANIIFSQTEVYIRIIIYIYTLCMQVVLYPSSTLAVISCSLSRDGHLSRNYYHEHYYVYCGLAHFYFRLFNHACFIMSSSTRQHFSFCVRFRLETFANVGLNFPLFIFAV